MKPGQRIEMSGRRFGRLTVVEYVKMPPPGFHRSGVRAFWRCRCDCGTETIIDGVSLRRGAVVSCGCKRRETILANRFESGHDPRRPSAEHLRAKMAERLGREPNLYRAAAKRATRARQIAGLRAFLMAKRGVVSA